MAKKARKKTTRKAKASKTDALYSPTLTQIWSGVKSLNVQISQLREQIQQMQQSQDDEEVQIMAALDDLRTQVAQNASVEGSAVTLIQGIAAQLQQALSSGDQAALQDLTNNLKSSADSLAAAVTQNTPQPTPTPTP